MGIMDKIGDMFEEGKGHVKESVGDLTDNERLQEQGQAEQLDAQADRAYTDARDGVADATRDRAFDEQRDGIEDATGDRPFDGIRDAAEDVTGTRPFDEQRDALEDATGDRPLDGIRDQAETTFDGNGPAGARGGDEAIDDLFDPAADEQTYDGASDPIELGPGEIDGASDLPAEDEYRA